MTGLYRGVRALLRALFALLFPIRVEGLEHFPATGAVMLCCNHISLRDPVLLIAVCPRMVRFMAKEELFHCKPFGWLLRHMGAFAVKRGESDLGSVRAALGVLQEGCVMGIFPQGHRDTQDQDRALKNGAAMIALRSRATVLPAHVAGPYRLFRPIRVSFYPPIALGDLQKAVNSHALVEATARIEQGIWKIT